MTLNQESNETNGVVVVTAHREGDLLIRCVDSLRRSSSSVELSPEVLVLLDNPDHVTVGICELMKVRYEIHNVSDVARLRNFALDNLNKRPFIVFIDADDWVSDNYFSELYRTMQETPSALILVPKFRIHIFEKFPALGLGFRQFNSKSKSLIKVSRITSLWGSNIVIREPARFGLRYPLEIDGFLFEDWWLMRKALEAGLIVETFGGTYYYFQKLSSSRRRQQSDAMRGNQVTASPGVKPEAARKLAALGLLALQWLGYLINK